MIAFSISCLGVFCVFFWKPLNKMTMFPLSRMKNTRYIFPLWFALNSKRQSRINFTNFTFHLGSVLIYYMIYASCAVCWVKSIVEIHEVILLVLSPSIHIVKLLKSLYIRELIHREYFTNLTTYSIMLHYVLTFHLLLVEKVGYVRIADRWEKDYPR